MRIVDIGEFLDYYGRLRDRTLQVAQAIPEEHLEWTYAPGRFTFGDILRHLTGMERWVWAENAHGRPARYPGCGRALAEGKAATLAYMGETHQESLRLLAALGPEDLARRVITPAGVGITCWKWLRALTEHEVHHRGQLFVYLGLLGVKTRPVFGLTSEEVQARSEPLT